MWEVGPDTGWTQANPGGRWAWEVWTRTLNGRCLWVRTRQPEAGWRVLVYHPQPGGRPTTRTKALARTLDEGMRLAERLAAGGRNPPPPAGVGGTQGRLF